MTNVEKARDHMHVHNIDGWLCYDFRGNNPVFAYVLGGKTRATSRRNYLFFPADGDPILLVHGLDHQVFSDVDYQTRRYTSWQEMDEKLAELLDGRDRIAMEYSPECAIPMSAFVDAGTIERLQKMGKTIVPSEDLFQAAFASWSDEAKASHERACKLVAEIKDAAFARIGEQLKAGETPHEYEIQQFILNKFHENGLVNDHGPIVAVNAHAGDPHYEPSEESSAPIRPGDWVLIDLWAKEDKPYGVYSDITWCGYCGTDVPAKHQEVFDTVLAARDAVVERLEQAWKAGDTVEGWEGDQIARDVITEAGYGDFFTHRTGHSMGISPTPHALGANLDNLETHDTRVLLPGIGFSVEPGIYLPDDFGVRSEIDMYVDPEHGPAVTTPIQREVILIGG